MLQRQRLQQIRGHAGPAQPALARLVTLAEGAGWPIFLVGGNVRDVLLGRPGRDLDLMIEGSAPALMAELVATVGGTTRSSPRFGTVRWCAADGTELDLASARAERYSKPGALPTVQLGATAVVDLARRDFSINAMAIRLDGDRAGQLLDPHGGLADLRAGRLRVLHPRSFCDDFTRAWRAARLSSRMGMRLAPASLAQLRAARAAGAQAAISPERLGAELARLWREPGPDRCLRALARWGCLAELLPELQLTARRLAQLRGAAAAAQAAEAATSDVAWLLCAVALSPAVRQRAARLARGARATQALWLAGPARLAAAQEALQHGTGRSDWGTALRGQTAAECAALWLLAPRLRPRLRWWQAHGRHVRSVVDGHELQRQGLSPGPSFQRALAAAYRAALAGALPPQQRAEALMAAKGDS